MASRAYIISDSTGDLGTVEGATAADALDAWATAERVEGEITGRASIGSATIAVVGRGLVRAEREPGEWQPLGAQQFLEKRSQLRQEDRGGFVMYNVRAWRGAISRRGRGGKQEIETCPHAHSRRSVAKACAERAAKRVNRANATDRKGASDGASRSAGTVPVGTSKEEGTMPSNKTSKTSKSNRKVGPKEAQARAQREAAATEAVTSDPLVDADPAVAAAAADAKAKPATKPVRELPSQDVDVAELEKALVAQAREAIQGLKVERKKTYSRVNLGKRSLAYLNPTKRALTVDVTGKNGIAGLVKIRVEAAGDVAKAVKAMVAAVPESK